MHDSIEKEAVIIVVSAECPVTNFGEDGTGEVDTDYAFDLPHQVGADSETTDLAADRRVKRLVKIVSATQSDIGIEPEIISRNTSVELRLQGKRKVVCNSGFGSINDSIDRGPASLTFEMERIYARTESVQFQVDVIFNDLGNFFSNAAAQRTDWNIWVTFVVFQPIADPAGNNRTD